MKAKKIESLLISILFPLAVGLVSALITNGMRSTYSQLVRPALSPPAVVFPIVWTILSILMGISAYLISTSDSEKKAEAMRVYFVQLGFNFFWSIFFFSFGWYLLSFVWLVTLIILIVKMIRAFKDINPVAAYLQIPYLLWCLFAAYLNFMIYYLNR